MPKQTEYCGRCSMSSVVDAVQDEESEPRDIFGEERIEVADEELRAVSPAAWLSGLTTKLDDFATRITYGR